MRHTFHAEQWLPVPLGDVFAFFSDPANLPRLMPGWQKARIDQASLVPPPPPPASATMLPVDSLAGAGTRLTMSFRPLPLSPVRLTWDAEITDFKWNDHFCDFQQKGPFAYWKHCHHVSVEARRSEKGSQIEGTLLRDHVVYQPPLGVLGEFGGFAIRMQLAATFRFRHKRTSELLTGKDR